MTHVRPSSPVQRCLVWAALSLAPAMLGARGCDTAVVGSECDGSPGECGSGYFCELPAGAACGSGRKGTCKPSAEDEGCTDEDAPVCGCDERTYVNACAAGKAGATIVGAGACAGEPCGGQAGTVCPSGQFCRYAPEADCGSADQTGTCEAIPRACDSIYIDATVCGCDGVTYANECEAELAGTSIRAQAECLASDRTPCGGLTGARCGAGEFCDYSLQAACGAADQSGECQPIPQLCTDLYAAVCGCDGRDYPNACNANAAGVAVASEGACAPSAGGAVCGGLLGGQCAPGEFCNYPIEAICGAADGTGRCEALPEVCTEILDPVCGCDGVSYGNACDAHFRGVSIASLGVCAPANAGTVCGGLLGTQCGEGELCNYPIEASCGAADQTGTCAAIPDVCPDIFLPVCGCDGNTYPSSCNANAAGVSVASEGACS
jgi:Kazal-type serine protease inhibitor-like protein